MCCPNKFSIRTKNMKNKNNVQYQQNERSTVTSVSKIEETQFITNANFPEEGTFLQERTAVFFV